MTAVWNERMKIWEEEDERRLEVQMAVYQPSKLRISKPGTGEATRIFHDFVLLSQ